MKDYRVLALDYDTDVNLANSFIEKYKLSSDIGKIIMFGVSVAVPKHLLNAENKILGFFSLGLDGQFLVKDMPVFKNGNDSWVNYFKVNKMVGDSSDLSIVWNDNINEQLVSKLSTGVDKNLLNYKVKIINVYIK